MSFERKNPLEETPVPPVSEETSRLLSQKAVIPPLSSQARDLITPSQKPSTETPSEEAKPAPVSSPEIKVAENAVEESPETPETPEEEVLVLENVENRRGIDYTLRTSANHHNPEKNADCFLQSPDKLTFGIFDGFGGQGEKNKLDSQIARDAVRMVLEQEKENPTLEDTQKLIVQALKWADRKLADERRGRILSEPLGASATLVKIWEGPFKGERKAVIGSLGDTRAYILRRDGLLKMITLDDNPDFLKRKEEFGEEQAMALQETISNLPQDFTSDKGYWEHFDNRTKLARYLGQGKNENPNVYTVGLQEGDRIILTTKGVHQNLNFSDMEMVLSGTGNQESAEQLVAVASSASVSEDYYRTLDEDASALIFSVPEMPPVPLPPVSSPASGVEAPPEPELAPVSTSASAEAGAEGEISSEEAASMGDRMLEIMAALAGQTGSEFFKTKTFWKFYEIISEFKLDKNSTGEQIEQAINSLVEKLPEGMCPKLDDLKKEDPKFIKDFSHDLAGVLVKDNPQERHAELDKLLDKYGVEGESRKLMRSAVDYLAKMKRGEVKSEETGKEKGAIKSKAEGLWGKVAGFLGALILVTFVFIIIVQIEAAERMLGKAGKAK